LDEGAGGENVVQLMTLQNFAAAANQSFGLAMGEAEMPMTLVEVKPLPAQPFMGMMREPFSLLFQSESQVVLPQRQYRLSNAQMGALDVFLVPVARDTQGIVYQAVFN
jgi:hypothetical protein